MKSLTWGGGERAEAVGGARQAAPVSTGGPAVFLGAWFPKPVVLAAAVAGAVGRHGGVEDDAFAAVPKGAVVVEAAWRKTAGVGGDGEEELRGYCRKLLEG